MKQMSRSTDMQNFLDKFAKEHYGISQSEAIGKNVCVSCKGDASSFRNALSAKEFSMSGLCQKCQDEVFGID